MGRLRRFLSTCLILAVTAGCSGEPISETPFVRVASEAASTLTAAELTLRFVHEEPARLTVEYGQGAMINSAEQLTGVPDELPALGGAPDQATVESLVALLEQAAADLEDPCLQATCDWGAQLSHITEARDALLDATE